MGTMEKRKLRPRRSFTPELKAEIVELGGAAIARSGRACRDVFLQGSRGGTQRLPRLALTGHAQRAMTLPTEAPEPGSTRLRTSALGREPNRSSPNRSDV